jgi:hypothetical protein
MKTNRFEWQEEWREYGGRELHDVVVERDGEDATGWGFYEKTSWDVTWVRIPATPDRLKRALAEECKKLGAKPKRRTLFQSAPVHPFNGRLHSCHAKGGSARIHGGYPRCTAALRLLYDRRSGHASPVRHALLLTEDVAKIGLVGQATGPLVEASDLETISREEEGQPPSHGRRVLPRRLLIVMD